MSSQEKCKPKYSMILEQNRRASCQQHTVTSGILDPAEFIGLPPLLTDRALGMVLGDAGIFAEFTCPALFAESRRP